MKSLMIYWLIGCLIVGVGSGLYENRCPNDEYLTQQNVLFEMLTWPAGVFYAIATIGHPLRACSPKRAGAT